MIAIAIPQKNKRNKILFSCLRQQNRIIKSCNLLCNCCKPKVAFICTHNSCRSQIAEAISKLIAADTFEAYSAGTEIKKQINPDAVNVIKSFYGVDMSQDQYPKLLSDIPPVDIVITMGCGVQCPFLPCKYREDWGVVDPTGKPEKEFIDTVKIIETKVKDLKRRIQESEIQLNK